MPMRPLTDVGRATESARYTRSDWLLIGLAGSTLVPFVAVRFFGVGAGIPLIVAAAMGVAIIAAAFFLSWATAGLEGVVPQSVALALLALIEIAPEYAVEVILAYRQQVELAAASMTGANRLLLGLGWPLIMLVAFVSARRRGASFTEIRLDARNAPEILFLLVASLYAFVMVVKGTFSLIDSVILILIYAGYILVALKLPPPSVAADDGTGERSEGNEDEEDEDEIGVGARTMALTGARKWVAISGFLIVGAFILYFGAERFIDAVLQVAGGLGVSQFILIQWVAPFLSEFPESLTAFIWAASIVYARKGLGNLISSKLNQWTLLIAAIPLAYSIGAGHTAALQLTTQTRDELFLTAAQSLFGVVLLLTMRFGVRAAAALTALFLLQFFIPIEAIRVIIGWLYLVLAAGFLAVKWREIRLFSALRDAYRGAGGARGRYE